MKICDLTQFYSPLSGGVKRYVQEKIAFIQKLRPNDEHVLVIPGAKDEIISTKQSRIYSIRSPLVSRATQYRILLNLPALDEVIAREKPDIIESGDPYQVGWRAIRIGRAQRIPVVAFYHSHFIEAYLRGPFSRLGPTVAERLIKAARAYVPNLYNRFDATLVPSAGLAALLREWGVQNTRKTELGVNIDVFHPGAKADAARKEGTRLLYVGRLASEKNTRTLFDAFALLVRRRPDKFHLLIIGDGKDRASLRRLESESGQVSWIPYCADSRELAQYYREADIFVHPGVEETFGLVAVESQACGTPVVGIRGSYMDDVIRHDQSAWASENSASALADAIEAMSVLDLPALGKTAAARMAQESAWPQIFSRLFSIYQELCASYYRKA